MPRPPPVPKLVCPDLNVWWLQWCAFNAKWQNACRSFLQGYTSWVTWSPLCHWWHTGIGWTLVSYCQLGTAYAYDRAGSNTRAFTGAAGICCRRWTGLQASGGGRGGETDLTGFCESAGDGSEVSDLPFKPSKPPSPPPPPESRWYRVPLWDVVSRRFLRANQVRRHPVLWELRRRELWKRLPGQVGLTGQGGGGEEASENRERGRRQNRTRFPCGFNCTRDSGFNCFPIQHAEVISVAAWHAIIMQPWLVFHSFLCTYTCSHGGLYTDILFPKDRITHH